MDKTFLDKLKKLNNNSNYIVNSDSICVLKNRIILPSGYFIGGYYSYNTYIISDKGDVVSTMYSSNIDPRNIFDKKWIEVKSRLFKEDFIKENNEEVEIRDKAKENLLIDASLEIENTYDLVFLKQSLNRILCGNYDYLDKKIKVIRPFELEKTMVDILEDIGMDEARFLGFSAIRDTYVEYINIKKEKINNKGKTLMKS